MNRKKRIIAKAIFAVLTAVMLFACKPEGEKVTGVVLDRRELKADIGQTVTLTATVLPAEAADPKVSWEAVPKGIVELTPDGALCTVKAVKDGAAVVTVTTEDGGFVTTCAVTVLPVPAESVTLDRETVSLVLGNKDTETATLTATVFPENATDKTVIWSAEPENIVELTDGKDGRCTVKALKDGTVTVTAVSLVDPAATAACRISVDYLHLTNTALIKAIDSRAKDSAGNPVSVGWTKESDGTVKLTPENLQKIRTVTELNLNDGSAGKEKLEDLGGIEYFTGLTYLNCGYNNLTTLDVSDCTALTTLNCGYNNLTTLDVSGCTALTSLSCSRNNLTTLDVSGCTALTTLNCGYNNLTTLDVSGCTALTSLNCNNNKLTKLVVTNNNTALTRLNCGYNNLQQLDIRPLSGLSWLYCTHQTESDGEDVRTQLTLILTGEQKLKLGLEENEYVHPVVFN